MGIFLIIIGLGWALLGGGNFLVVLAAAADAPPDGPLHQMAVNKVSVALIVNAILFILPGLVLAGIGALVRSHRKAPPATP